MATINLRIDDDVRDALESQADAEGVSLSQYVRDLLREAVVPVWNRPEQPHGDEQAPDSMDFMDRKVLSLLHRILGRLLPPDANGDDGDMAYQLDRAKVLEEGFTGEYWMEAAGFATELSKTDSRRVNDILEMFRILGFSVRRLEEDGSPLDPDVVSDLSFQGFDGNHALEGQILSYVRFLVEHDRWSELKPFMDAHEGGNSHSPMLETYSRMLAAYRRIMESRVRKSGVDAYALSEDELQTIIDEQTHPSRR
jgi:uncharacterized protein YfbU (UPF0304 family)